MSAIAEEGVEAMPEERSTAERAHSLEAPKPASTLPPASKVGASHLLRLHPPFLCAARDSNCHAMTEACFLH